MAEILIGAGDCVSKLLQVLARELGLKRVWSGEGRKDARDILVELHNTMTMKHQLWIGLAELYAMPELKELPENVQAKLMSIILASRANAELATKV